MLARYRPLRGPKRLGDRLLEAGLITRTQLDAALDQQAGGRDPHCHLGRVLVDLGFLTDRDLLQMLGVHLAIPVAASSITAPEEQAIHAIPAAMARRHRAVPYRVASGSLLVAVADRLPAEALHEIEAVAGRPVVVQLAPEAEIEAALGAHYAGVADVPAADVRSNGANLLMMLTAPDAHEPVPARGGAGASRRRELADYIQSLADRQARVGAALAEAEAEARTVAEGDLGVRAELQQVREDNEAMRRSLVAIARALAAPDGGGSPAP